MRRQVRWLRRAVDDLERQIEFISRDNPRAATRVVAILRQAGNELSEYAVGRPGRMRGTYEKILPRLPYILCFRIVRAENGERVEIIRVIHTARNWTAGSWPDD